MKPRDSAGLDRGLGHGFDASAENLDVEGSSKAGQRNDRPADIGNDWHFEPAIRAVGGGERAKGEVEKQQLHEGRRVAKELDIDRHDPTDQAAFGALQRCAEHPDQHAGHDAGNGNLCGHPDAADDFVPLPGFVEKYEIPRRLRLRKRSEIVLKRL